MIIQEILNHDNQFKYMLLNRLQSDCYSYLDHGGKLWGIDKDTHINTMIAIWNDLKVKPEWLELSELKELAYRLVGISKLGDDQKLYLEG